MDEKAKQIREMMIEKDLGYFGLLFIRKLWKW